MTISIGYHSPKKRYEKELHELLSITKADYGVITESDIDHLPEPVKRYIRAGGFISQPKVDVVEIIWSDCQIKLGPDRNCMKLKTHQYNFVSSGSRLAYMRACIAGVIPFEGRDKFSGGQGSMLGVLGKTVKLFDNSTREVGLGGAVVYLAESLLEPSIALQEYITWEPVDKKTAKATFKAGDIEVSGLFFFNDEGEFIRFESHDRPYEVSPGIYEVKPYSIKLGDYHESGGIKVAGQVFATWHLEDGDFTYWDGKIKGLRRNVK
jgi:hypothetical protein